MDEKKEASGTTRTLRCKMRVGSVTRDINPDGSVNTETVSLQAVYGDTPENKSWSRWTPSGSVQIQISNPDAFGALTKGHEFFVDFTPATA